MAIPQASTTVVTEASAPIAGATATQNVDLVQLWSAFLQTNVVRQVMVLGDPVGSGSVASVTNTVPGGQEFALLVRLTPGSPELQSIVQELRNIRAELQAMQANNSGVVATAPAFIDSSQSGGG